MSLTAAFLTIKMVDPLQQLVKASIDGKGFFTLLLPELCTNSDVTEMGNAECMTVLQLLLVWFIVVLLFCMYVVCWYCCCVVPMYVCM